MVQITAIESVKISSCPNGTDPSARARIAAPNAMPPPRMRQSSGRRSLQSDQQHADDRNGWDEQPQEEHRLAREHARKPAG
jgi:hypothetical protein